jgi:hypothetical protein
VDASFPRRTGARGGTVGRKLLSILVYPAIIAIAFAIYMANGELLASYDSAPNSLLAFNVLREHRLDFDRFRGSYFSRLGGQYAFTEAPDGHLMPVFPIGTAIVTLPIYAVLALLPTSGAARAPIESAAFEPFRGRAEKIAAALVAAIAAALFFACARELGSLAPATVATAVFALGTSMWSIGSQALWQHGPVNLVVLAMFYVICRAARAREPAARARWLAAAGLCAGLLPVIRPTAVIFAAAAGAFSVTTFRRDAWWFIATLPLGAAPGVLWNLIYFHALAGGYAGDARSYTASARQALAALAGLIVSPSRGLLTFSPVLILAVVGARSAARRTEPSARLILWLAAAAAVLIVQYAFYREWWAGFTYGPRFLTDIAGVASLLLMYVLPPDPAAFIRRGVAGAAAAAGFVLLFGYSLAVQFAGVTSGAGGSEWNAVPVSIDAQPQRVWAIADSQIERNLRAAYLRFFAWNAGRANAADYSAVQITTIDPALARGARGAAFALRAELRNTGRRRLYGYASGVYVGQLRVRVRMIDRNGRAVPDQYLYVRESPRPGERGVAGGLVALPSEPGTYRVEYLPVGTGAGGAAASAGGPYQAQAQVR